MTSEVRLEQFDDWLRDDSEVAALTMRQWLEPVEGKDAVIFPPTYAKPEGMKDSDWDGYNIDRFGDTSVCQIDSVGSQANRMEPIFKRERYKHLVPQVTVKAKEKSVNLLDASHRAADAVVRFSGLSKQIEIAFAKAGAGNAELLARFAPTLIVFGAWDSRATQVKLPRIVRSVIRAYHVKQLHRSAQYIPPLDYVKEGLLDEPNTKDEKDAMSELGFSHNPATWKPGGIFADENLIRRDAALNLVALRSLAAESDKGTLPLRRYILGLSLVSLTAPQDGFLREGCQLVVDCKRPAEWNQVSYDGSREAHSIEHKDVLAYATAAAREVGVRETAELSFDAEGARSELAKSKKERKKSRGKGKGTAAVADDAPATSSDAATTE